MQDKTISNPLSAAIGAIGDQECLRPVAAVVVVNGGVVG